MWHCNWVSVVIFTSFMEASSRSPMDGAGQQRQRQQQQRHQQQRTERPACQLSAGCQLKQISLRQPPGGGGGGGLVTMGLNAYSACDPVVGNSNSSVPASDSDVLSLNQCVGTCQTTGAACLATRIRVKTIQVNLFNSWQQQQQFSAEGPEVSGDAEVNLREEERIRRDTHRRDASR